MNARRLEQLVIAILLVLDLCLLAVVAADRLQARRDREGLRAQVIALLEENGIRADGLTLPETHPRIRLLRDAELELALMEKLVGADSGEEQGGGIRYYRGDRGQALLRGTGEIELLFSGLTGRDGLRAAEKLFADAGLPLGEVPRAAESEDAAARCCLADGIPVVNAAVEFSLAGGSVSLVTGVVPFRRETERSAEGVMDAATALSRFLAAARSEGIVCSRLEEIAPAYLMSVPVAGECVLTPLWRIRADTGSFYLNAMTGRLESV